MEDKHITAEEIMAEIDLDVRQMAKTVADAINNAEPGSIINQSEEQVRDAHAVFRKATYQKALSLLEKNQRAFSPSAESPRGKLE
jgi:predicted transcriptional regulator